MGQNENGQADGDGDITGVVKRNITSLVERRRREEKQRPLTEWMSDRITRFTGSMLFVIIHVFLFGSWIVINLGWTPIPKFDPTFVVLGMVASVEAIFLSTFVLITQNRMAEQAGKRSELDLQISLLAEHEITRIIRIVSEIAGRSGIDLSRSPELGELMEDVAPEKVLDTMEENERD